VGEGGGVRLEVEEVFCLMNFWTEGILKWGSKDCLRISW